MKSPTVCLLALCLGAASVHAQNAAPPFVFNGPPAATVPVPLDEKPGVQLRSHLKGTFSVRLINVKPSLMAYWLDPQHNPVPLGAFGPLQATTRFAVRFGIERLEADDKTNTLIIHGAQEAAQQLSKTIALLDTPQYLVQFDCVAFWVDSLSPEAAKWNKSSLEFQSADAGQIAELESLADTDRAARLGLQVPGMQAEGSFVLSLPFEVPSEKPSFESHDTFPGIGQNKRFDYQMPRLHSDIPIDPEMSNLNRSLPNAFGPTSLHITHFIRGENTLMFVEIGGHSLSASARFGESLLLFGSAKAFGLMPPSPRFGALVVKIPPTPVRVVNELPRSTDRLSIP